MTIAGQEPARPSADRTARESILDQVASDPVDLSKICAMVLAAGFGTRLRPLTEVLPKALVPVEGRALLDWNLSFLAASGIRKTVVNAHHHAEQMKTWLRDRFPDAVPKVTLLVEPEILGTAGGIANAAPHLDSDPILIFNVDQIFRPDLARVVAFHRGLSASRGHTSAHDPEGRPERFQTSKGGLLATLVCTRDPCLAQIRIEDGRVVEITSRPEFAQPALCAFTGVYLLSSEAMEQLPREGYAEITPLFRAWAKEGRLGGLLLDETPFREVGTPEAYLELHRDLAGSLRSALLGAPRSREERGANQVSTAKEEAAGFPFIAPAARVAPDADLEECVVLEGALVQAGAVVRRSILGPGSVTSGSCEGLLLAGGHSKKLSLLTRREEEEIRAFLARHARAGCESTSPVVTQAIGSIDRPPRSIRLLAGDGSRRRIIRVAAVDTTCIVVQNRPAKPEEIPPPSIYPRREDPGAPDENETFCYVAGYLDGLGVRVPRVWAFEKPAGLLLLEDLGGTLLFDVARSSNPLEREQEDLYREAIEILCAMQKEGREPFDPGRVFNVRYDQAFILRYEAGYFHREMVQGLARLSVPFEEIEAEYARAAREALEGGRLGFMHRDYQSRNLIVIHRGLAVIDFQGARLGPAEYDLASLLLDPYAELPSDLRQRLLEHYFALRGSPDSVGRERILRRYRASGINRMLQALGAYGYLGGRLGKPGFLEHAPAALSTLRELTREDYPRLSELCEKVEARLITAKAAR